MVFGSVQSEPQNSIPPWKLPNQTETTSFQDQRAKLTGSSKKLIYLIALTVVLIITAGVVFATGVVKLEKITEIIPLLQDNKYETSFYELSLPKSWDVEVQDSTIKAIDPNQKIREVTISSIEYSQSLVDQYKRVGIKDPHVYHARYRTSECHMDEATGQFCERLYYLWNEDLEMMVTVKIKWEIWTLEEIAQDESSFKKAQNEGLPKAHPSIEKMESTIFKSFRFKEPGEQTKIQSDDQIKTSKINGWKTYKSEKFGFQFEYPDNWEADTRKSENSLTIVLIQSKSFGSIQAWDYSELSAEEIESTVDDETNYYSPVTDTRVVIKDKKVEEVKIGSGTATTIQLSYKVTSEGKKKIFKDYYLIPSPKGKNLLIKINVSDTDLAEEIWRKLL